MIDTATDDVSQLPSVEVLGVTVTNVDKAKAIGLMEAWIQAGDQRARSIFIVNAHTLNLAFEMPDYRSILNDSDVVFGDGTGVRLAARLRGVRMADNLVGTDLLPDFFTAKLNRGYGYFLLGGGPNLADRAAACLQQYHPGIRIVGTHQGFLDDEQSTAAVTAINAAKPDVLLVGMGNPLQETWIHRHKSQLRVPVCVGVGGLFDHWAGNLTRASLWIRRAGAEWVQILAQQPRRKWRRYLVGNPKFIARAVAGRKGSCKDETAPGSSRGQ